ncbi:MAG: hypothetical protein Q9217_001841 [Psora testacea]
MSNLDGSPKWVAGAAFMHFVQSYGNSCSKKSFKRPRAPTVRKNIRSYSALATSEVVRSHPKKQYSKHWGSSASCYHGLTMITNTSDTDLWNEALDAIHEE